MDEDDIEKASFESYDTYQYIPYLTISGEERFLKKEIDKWLEYQTFNKHS